MYSSLSSFILENPQDLDVFSAMDFQCVGRVNKKTIFCQATMQQWGGLGNTGILTIYDPKSPPDTPTQNVGYYPIFRPVSHKKLEVIFLPITP